MKKTILLCSIVSMISSPALFAVEGADGAQPAPPVKTPALKPEELIKKFDANDDGKLSKDEYLGRFKKPEKKAEFQEKFTKLDTNEDGFLSLEELKANGKPEKKAEKKVVKKAVKKPAAK